jgi:hypothetical protein
MIAKRLLFGDRRTIAGTVYGTIIVMSIVAAGAKHYEQMLWRLVVLTAVSAIVLWLAHVYARGLGESLKLGHRLTLGEVTAVARRERSIVLAAVAPVAAVALGGLNLVSQRAAIALALGVGVVTLAVQGVRYARLERLSFMGGVVTVTLNSPSAR